MRHNSLLGGITISPTKLANTSDINDDKTHYAIQINNAYYLGELKPF